MNIILNFLEKQFLKKIRPLSEFTVVINHEQMGRGVQLLEPIKAGTLLGIYPGAHKSLTEFLEKEDFVTRSVKFAYLHNENEIIDPTDMFGFVPDQPQLRIALVNEPSEDEHINVIAVSSNKHVWYVAITDIEIGQQLFTNYGDFYERNYKAKKLKFSAEQIECLKVVARKHLWLKAGLKFILEDS